MEIEIIYANSERQLLMTIDLTCGSTLKQAIEFSGILTLFPEIDIAKNPVGIFGKKMDLNTPLQPNDRVEIYRPLKIDPKTARRLRAQVARLKQKSLIFERRSAQEPGTRSQENE